MIKEICYAYPSSTSAKKFNREKEGCYFVQATGENGRQEQHGPYTSTQFAESMADKLYPGAAWASWYKAHPLPGSHFLKQPYKPETPADFKLEDGK